MPKGVYIRSAETRLAISRALTGKPLSESRRLKLVGNTNGFKKGHLDLVTAEGRLQQSYKMKGRMVSQESREKLSKSQFGKKRSLETRIKLSIAHGGRGIIREKRCSPEEKQWRSDVFVRDNWTCQTCYKRSGPGNQVYIVAHHIKSWANYPLLRFDTSNGVTLCRECHALTDNYKGKNTRNKNL